MRENDFSVSIIGLGLIGGSLAMALNGFRKARITAFDTDSGVLRRAMSCGAIHNAAESLSDAVSDSDLVVFCTAPAAVMENVTLCAPFFKHGALVTEVCGVKTALSSFMAETVPPYAGYVGLHPMAGKELGGFQNAAADLFRGAGFIITTVPGRAEPESVALIEEMSYYVGASAVIRNTPDSHDDIIAYTSDLMHIAATALCADYPESMTMAHTAGAFRDCTRIARIDADLWTELLEANSEFILPRLECYIENLRRVHEALSGGDSEALRSFLHTACENKKEMQSRC